MISCKIATKLISKQEDEGLNFFEKLALVSHTLVCWACRRFQKQIQLITLALRETINEKEMFEKPADQNLNPDRKKEILKFIRSAKNIKD